MNSAKITSSLEPEALQQVDRLVEGEPSQAAARSCSACAGSRLAQECAKLQPLSERAAAEERFRGEAEWPEY